MLEEFLQLNIFGFFLIFSRTGTMFMLMPGFSAQFVSVRIRLGIALAVSFAVAPVLAANLPGMPSSPAALVLLFVGEVVTGAFLGTLARIVVGALHTSGTLVALFSSMANVLIRDPIAEQQSALLAGFLGNVGILLIFVTDMHHLMLRAMIDSYSLFVPGQPLNMSDMSHMVARQVMDSFTLGVQLASPFIISGLTYYLGLGLLGRLMPALPVFFIGLPLQIMAQLSVLAIALSGMMLVFLSRFEDTFTSFLAP